MFLFVVLNPVSITLVHILEHFSYNGLVQSRLMLSFTFAIMHNFVYRLLVFGLRIYFVLTCFGSLSPSPHFLVLFSVISSLQNSVPSASCGEGHSQFFLVCGLQLGKGVFEGV